MADPAPGQAEFLIVARVRRPHGVRGELLVALDTDRPKQVFRADRLLHLADTWGTATGQSLHLRRMRPTTGGAILTLEGVGTREAAEALRGHALMIDASDAHPAGADEVHYRDLVGLSVWSGDREIGRVEDILEIAPGELLVIRGEEGRELLIPFVKEMVKAVELETGTLRLTLPDGLLEL